MKEFRRRLEQLKGRRDEIHSSLDEACEELKTFTRRKVNAEHAQLIIQEVARQTQSQLEYHISDVVSTALTAVFDDPYELKLEFVDRRGKTEADITFVRDGQEIEPLSSAGGGAVDVASFALRIALWSLSKPRSRATIILDEPFRFLSANLQPRAGEMLRMLSEKMGVQFIIVTHNKSLIESADKVFTVSKPKAVSLVVEGN